MRRGENWRVEKVSLERVGGRGAVREEKHWRGMRGREEEDGGLLTIDIISINAGRSSITGKNAYNSFAMHECTRYLLRPTHF